MTQYIINTYGIKFTNLILPSHLGKMVHKLPETNNEYLTDLLIDCTLSYINEELLPIIEDALIDPLSEISSNAEVINIIVHQADTDLYNYDGYCYSLPTSDLKQIIVGLRDFLSTEPLHGSTVI